MDYVNSDRLLFITASAGAGAHRFGRIISCIDNVYWYANDKRNGSMPWDVFPTDAVKGKDISRYHFDRLVTNDPAPSTKNMIPLAGERIERFWNESDIDEFYKTKWSLVMNEVGADKIINSGKYLLWILHDSPQYLLNRFPNAKIINLIDTDIDYVIRRYMKTTALFPINIINKNIKPDYINSHAQSINDLMNFNPSPTYRDYWSWNKFKKPVFQNEMETLYAQYVTKMLTEQHIERIKENPKYLNVTWDNLDINTILNYLNAKSIDNNYVDLLH